jgi:DNA processing protein
LSKFKSPPIQQILKKSVAVVGSRLNIQYTEDVLTTIVPQLVQQHYSVISGFSVGVDTIVHKLTIGFNGTTVAVLPCGIKHIIPARNKTLYWQILKSGGLIVSEYRNSVPCAKWLFARRNKIIAGLSQSVIVAEAGKNSGALITAKFAQKAKKQVFAIPHNITNANSYGVNQLISTGVQPIYQIKPLLLQSYINIPDNTKPRVVNQTKVNKISSEETQILKMLHKQPLNLDEISLTINKRKIDVINLVTNLEINNLIERRGVKYYVCKR